RWYLTRVVSPSIRRSRDGLTAFGIEHFLPQIREWKKKPANRLSRLQRASKVPAMIQVDRPLWQGYLLVRFDIENDAWRNVFSQPGRVGIIGCSDEPGAKPQPYAIADAAIAVLKEFSVTGAIPSTVTKDQLVKRLRAVLALTSEQSRDELDADRALIKV